MKALRIGALLLALLMVCPVAVAESTDSFVMMGYDDPDSGRDWANNQFFTRMEDITGVSFTYQQYKDQGAYQAAKETAFATGDLPDVLFKALLTPQEEMDLLASGQLVDLAPYLEEHTPALYAILEARPDWRAAITQPDGSITSLPILNGSDRQCAIWINRTWLDTLELQMPTTIDELTEVLRAFRDSDPNRNGRYDEVPMSIVGPWEAKFLLHAWGLAPNDYNLYVDDSGKVQYAPFADEYREFAAWLHMATEESLINDDAFRTTHAARSAATQTTSSEDSASPLIYGTIVTSAPYTMVDMDATTQYNALTPLSYEGKQVYRQLLNGVGRGTFAVTSACDDIPAVLSWVDYLYTEDGGRLAFAGLVGEDYTFNEDGTWAWNSQGDYTWLTQMVSNSIIAGDAITPGLEPVAFMRNTEIIADNHTRRQTDTLRTYLVEAFPVTWPTDSAREAKIAELQEALGTCVDTAIANFAMGKVELNDETWQAFQDELHELGVDEFLSLWQAKYDELGL